MMIPMSLREIATFTRGELHHATEENVEIGNITTNSKDVKENSLFVAIKGERFDGHDFIGDFYRGGGVAAVSSRLVEDEGNLIVVGDTRLALGDIARHYRKRFTGPVVGITGSVGKTSTRRMIACVLSTQGSVCSTKGNLNNEIGLPLTLLSWEEGQRYAVVELGMNHLGEIRYLSGMARPDIAVITNIGTAHIGNLGSREKILEAKLEIVEGMPSSGVLVLNGDDDLLYRMKDRIPLKTITYGIHNPDCDIVVDSIEPYPNKSIFTLRNDREMAISVNSPGTHQVYNALPAIAVGRQLGLPMPAIAEGIQAFQPGNMRQNIIRAGRVTIIEDCYNACPDSMEAALKVLASFANAGVKVAVIGNMYELGAFTEQAHRQIGDCVAGLPIDLLVTVGEYAHLAAEQAKKRPIDCVSFATNGEAISFLKDTVRDDDVVLIKASRGAKFEEISQGLLRHLDTAARR
ncbi:MAG: UDP-N-acetylmuramoyl-tripeptide--D-alanyl-D-alanine ligase [Oscillospiraceae bacterium]|nr:UDP-N-acetylmuramoyl-tripeptide--D-alanyl-D-alanine ligase [Oscillospiraceae bacterium]